MAISLNDSKLFDPEVQISFYGTPMKRREADELSFKMLGLAGLTSSEVKASAKQVEIAEAAKFELERRRLAKSRSVEGYVRALVQTLRLY